MRNRFPIACLLVLFGIVSPPEVIAQQDGQLAPDFGVPPDSQVLWNIVTLNDAQIGDYLSPPPLAARLPLQYARMSLQSRTVARVWHVHFFYTEAIQQTRPACQTQSLHDLLMDDAGFIVGYRHREITPDTVRSLRWDFADLGSRQVLLPPPLRQLPVILADPSRLLSLALAPHLRGTSVEHRILSDLENDDDNCIKSVQFAAEEMGRWELTATRVLESSLAFTVEERQPITALINSHGRVELLALGEIQKHTVARIKPALLRNDPKPISQEPAIRLRLRESAHDIDAEIGTLHPAFVTEQPYYLAADAVPMIERLRQKVLDSLDEAVALRGTMMEILQRERPLATRMAALYSGNYIALVSNTPVAVVSASDLKAAADTLKALIAHILSFDSLQPDVRCQSRPTGARLVIRVGDSEPSERFADTNGAFEKLWRGIYRGEATILAGGFKPAHVELDVFNQKSAGIVCSFQPLTSARPSICVQTKGE